MDSIDSQKVSVTERQSCISRMLWENNKVSVPDLAVKFGVCEMTVRRDLDKLENSGHVRRTHGGALPTEKIMFEFDFTARRKKHKREKQAIAKEALKLIQPGHRLILDTGTTTLELAYYLKEFKDITVITPCIAVASILQFSSNIETILLGGIIRPKSPTLTGPVAETMLDMYAVDIAFQGIDGIGIDGTLYATDIHVAAIERKIRQRSAKSCLLCDSSKIGKTALATNGTLKDIDALIIDENIKPGYLKAFRKLCKNITVVDI